MHATTSIARSSDGRALINARSSISISLSIYNSTGHKPRVPLDVSPVSTTHPFLISPSPKSICLSFPTNLFLGRCEMSTSKADDHFSSSDDDSADDSEACSPDSSGYDADVGEASPTSMPAIQRAPSSSRPTTGVLAPRGYRRPAEVELPRESKRGREDMVCGRRVDSDAPQPTGAEVREEVRSQCIEDAARARSGACPWSFPVPQEDTSDTISDHLEGADNDDDDDSHVSGESEYESTDSPIEDAPA